MTVLQLILCYNTHRSPLLHNVDNNLSFVSLSNTTLWCRMAEAFLKVFKDSGKPACVYFCKQLLEYFHKCALKAFALPLAMIPNSFSSPSAFCTDPVNVYWKEVKSKIS